MLDQGLLEFFFTHIKSPLYITEINRLRRYKQVALLKLSTYLHILHAMVAFVSPSMNILPIRFSRRCQISKALGSTLACKAPSASLATCAPSISTPSIIVGVPVAWSDSTGSGTGAVNVPILSRTVCIGIWGDDHDEFLTIHCSITNLCEEPLEIRYHRVPCGDYVCRLEQLAPS